MDDILTVSRTVLESTPGRWTRLAETLPAALLTRPPAPNEWSALECLGHLLDTERDVFPARLGYFLAGQDFPAFNPDNEGTKVDQTIDPVQVAEEFARLRAKSLELLAKISPADLDRQARHGELGPVTLDEMLHEWAAHDLMHTVQAERALMQPFIAGCGPWLPYFADHWVGEKRV